MSDPQPVIRLHAIEKTFMLGDLSVEVLKGVSLAIDPGEFVALRGASGSGKSTLMHILGLLDRPSGGQYYLQGEDVAGLPDDRLSELRNRLFGFIFQTFYLIPYISALDNVMLPGLYGTTPARRLRQQAERLLCQVGLEERMHFRPGQLSGGQQQRVAMARALLNDPQVVLADEPTGQLDSTTSTEIMALLQSIHAQGRTVVLVTHDAATAGYAGRQIVLSDGHVQAG
ncbi:MAG: ABC transporter ATP-binding protein [Syntrophotalea acetylenica]|jgi:putative ABC transport system ATP-binding protein|uniref:Macrolide ABC transporter ATP-binding protein n=1 Tax=Syntrophotalea acetylenica TaxID=29542 RepID=A0A1L3GFL3_SYNAC|nr:ABC transporter ATP-binding protein [Syntrophotalea acetylenica]APG24635.1 macrolide ABC transporter ATP-binding protein [Syntrophotalea acetylenica]APG45217.1 macrolide ABC transporter ATP-binding protein [Syntrophotalea acetylenica]MDD4455997.1 ABC transporter ATP-binding protein [Syntrophotalea acetylenica]MDY0262209.1 ABC transporter ATP-binding protein [Syntrophotalea acetylenica]